MIIGILGDYNKAHYQAFQTENLLREGGAWTLKINKHRNYLNLKYILSEINKSDIFYSIGNTRLFFLLIAKILGKPIVRHWIGTDVLSQINHYNVLSNKLSIKLTDYHLTTVSWLKSELSSVGIESEMIPIVSNDICFDLLYPPKQHRVLVYLDEKRPDFYGACLTIQLAEHFRDFPFEIIGTSGAGLPKLKNITFHGWITPGEMNELYKEISVLLRIPDHDGLSMMVIEALAKGKEVVYRYDFPHCIAADNFDKAVQVLRTLFSKPPRQNSEGHELIINKYSKEKIFEQFDNYFCRILRNKK
jgi:hypothetical protein